MHSEWKRGKEIRKAGELLAEACANEQEERKCRGKEKKIVDEKSEQTK